MIYYHEDSDKAIRIGYLGLGLACVSAMSGLLRG